jgi:hypothetical protein
MTEKEFITDSEKAQETIKHISIMIENIKTLFDEIPDYLQITLGLAVVCGVNVNEETYLHISGSASGVQNAKDKIVQVVADKNNLIEGKL